MTPDAHMVETLRLRTAALHRVISSNDQVRRQLDEVRKIADLGIKADWNGYRNGAIDALVGIVEALDGTP